ncbi:MAG: SLC13/DASS family transporter [bacterium]|nr:MAG: SLC13/DASS family transporter [bacterium]
MVRKTPYGFRSRFGLLLGPLLFVVFLVLPERVLEGDAKRVAAVAALMAVWWICESIPLAATALIPLVAFPLLKVVPCRTAASSYAAPEIFLFMGGFFIAIAMQRWNLHRRIALGIVRLVGVRGDRIILGFMLATAFLSMWISNTATTMMMLPIGLAVLMTLEEHTTGACGERFFEFKTALMLSIAYAANIGGIGTLIGTPPNIVFAAQVRTLFPRAGEISFVKWMAVGLPLVAVFIPITWLVLTRLALRGAHIVAGSGADAIEREHAALGPMSPGEKRTLVVFLATVAAWITRADITVGEFTFRGWASLLSLGPFAHDSTVAMAAAITLFLVPVDWRRGIFLLDWKSAREIPWGILILFGGGIALGKGFSESGLAAKIAGAMEMCGGAPIVLLIVLTALLVTFLTEITSNTAVATIFLPILAATAVGLSLHPFLLMIPAAISASCAFMLPVATPPNAIVFSSGAIPMTGMVRIGVMMNFIGIALVTLVVYLLAIPVFGILVSRLPEWIG